MFGEEDKDIASLVNHENVDAVVLVSDKCFYFSILVT